MESYPLNSLPSLGAHERIFGAASATRDMLPIAIIVAVILFVIGAGAVGVGISFYLKTRSYRPLGGIVLGTFFLLFVCGGAYMLWDFLRTAPWQLRTGDAGILVNTNTQLFGVAKDTLGNSVSPSVLFIRYDEIESVRQTEEHYLFPLRPSLENEIVTKQEVARCLSIRLKPFAAAQAVRALGTDVEARNARARRVGTRASLINFVRLVRMADDRTVRIQWDVKTNPDVGNAVQDIGARGAAPEPHVLLLPGEEFQNNPALWEAMDDTKRGEYMRFLVERGMIAAAEKMAFAFQGTRDSEERVRKLFFQGIDVSDVQLPQDAIREEHFTTRAQKLIVDNRPIIVVVLLALAILLSWPVYRNVRDARASTDWPTAQGTIIESQVGKPGVPRELFIRYKYRVAGQEYESGRISFKGFSGRTSTDMCAQYPLGSEVTLRYRPEDPSRSVLEPGFVLMEFSTPPFVVEIIGFLLLVVVALIFVSEPRARIYDQIQQQKLLPEDAGSSVETSIAVAPASSMKPGSQMSTEELFGVIKKGSIADIMRLFDSGADVNVRYPANGETPLMACVAGNNLELVKYLVGRKADVNAISRKDATALAIAAERGYADIVKVLADHGADVRRLDKQNGLHALFYAAARGHLDIARILMEKGADIRVRAKNGATVLTDAVQNYHEGLWNTDVELAEAVQFFLENNVDPTLKDSDGKSALDYAKEFSVDSAVIWMLKSALTRAPRSK